MMMKRTMIAVTALLLAHAANAATVGDLQTRNALSELQGNAAAARTNIGAAASSDSLNLKNLGAALNGSSADQATIDSIYAALPDGAEVDIPAGGRWFGSLTAPNPHKSITWNVLGSWPNPYNTIVGDGDLSISGVGGQLNVMRSDANTTRELNNATFTLFNNDPNFPDAYGHNYNQLAPLAAFMQDGATSSGNNSGLSVQGRSYGMRPAGSFDVGIDQNWIKYGQNSTWGMVLDDEDFSGRVPQAFATWLVELDQVANGHDISPMDPHYYIPQRGNRVGIALGPTTVPWPAWAASTPAAIKNTAQNASSGQTQATVIKGTDTGGTVDVWVASGSGTTGTTQPTWPAPAEFTGSLSATGVLTVTAMASGSPAIAVGQVLTGSGFVAPVAAPAKVVSQLTGTGGVGTYQTNWLHAVPATGLYADRQVLDGTAVWDFGTEYAVVINAGFWYEGAPSAGVFPGKVNDAFGTDAAILGAAFDASQATLGPGAAAIRMAAGMPIDFTANGTRAGLNQRTLSYSTYAGTDALTYVVAGKGAVFEATDTGKFTTLHNTLDDGSGNQLVSGKTVEGAPQIISADGAQTISGSVNTVLVTVGTSALTLTLPNPGDAIGSVQKLEIIFAAADSRVAYTAASGVTIGGAALPASVPKGGDIQLVWLSGTATWVHTVAE